MEIAARDRLQPKRRSNNTYLLERSPEQAFESIPTVRVRILEST